jgi:hypothetical protein
MVCYIMNIIVKDEEGIKKYDTCQILTSQQFSNLGNFVKINILELLNKKPMFINELAKKLNLNQQNIYYHMKDLFPLLDVVEERKVRGTIAKKYKPKSMNFCLCLSKNFKNQIFKDNYINNEENLVNKFFIPFIKDGFFNAKIIVGSPDLHGPYKARARDGHYAIDFAIFLGNYCKISQNFSVSLDVDITLKETNSNLIVVGGPVTNLIMDSINDKMPIHFIEGKQWVIKGKKAIYSDDNIGIVARFQHPYYLDKWILVLAGIRFSGTKATVLGLTRNTKLMLNHFSGQKEFYAIVQGFDLDGDGKIDSIELLESF